MKSMTVVCCAMLVLSLAAPADAQGPSRRRGRNADEVIQYYVDVLLRAQKEDGRWTHSYEQGMTGLAVLALKHSNDTRAATAVARGAAYLAQADTEYKTYSAGMVVSALYEVNPQTYRRTIDKYAGILVKSQLKGMGDGMYSYHLMGAPNLKNGLGRGDNSNTQFGVLGLLFAERAGYQVPRSVWTNVRDHYIKTQNPDGGWGYTPGRDSYHNMTYAGAVSLYIAEEQLALAQTATACKMVPESRGTQAAMKWVGDRFTTDLNTYGLYALERLGILTGRSEFNGHAWYAEGTKTIMEEGGALHGDNWGDAGAAFIVLFLSRGKEPIIINKLQYYGDWNTCHYDVKHMTEYISDRMQMPMQWRIVTLKSKVEDLAKVPILHVNGINGPQFTADEMIKIRQYVLGGGTLMAQACRGGKGAGAFDENFRAMLEEVFPESTLEELPAAHRILQTPRKVAKFPKILIMKIKGRIGVIYLPEGVTLDWHRGGSSAKSSFDAGVNIVFYVLKEVGIIGKPGGSGDAK